MGRDYQENKLKREMYYLKYYVCVCVCVLVA